MFLRGIKSLGPAARLQQLHVQAGFSPVQAQLAARVVYLPKAAEEGESSVASVGGATIDLPLALQAQLDRAAKGAGATCVVYPEAPVAGASTVVFVGTGTKADEALEPSGNPFSSSSSSSSSSSTCFLLFFVYLFYIRDTRSSRRTCIWVTAAVGIQPFSQCALSESNSSAKNSGIVRPNKY